jgi:hypothetical protein
MWVENLMANASGSILGIQALRNSILSSTFYATACATIAFFAGRHPIYSNFAERERPSLLVA